ncbi:MAG: hypothetical protein GX184_00220 [Clostridiaceae bacterium]|nr:hypothetical protein [Clostridiaceae bacterium]
MKKNISTVLIVFLLITQVILLIKISSLENSLEHHLDSLKWAQENINSSIDSVYSHVNNVFEKKESLLEHAEFKIGAPDKENLTIPITYTVIPKEVGSKTSVSLELNGEIHTMERNGTSFTVTVFEDIFSAEIFPKILIADDDIVKTELNVDLNIWNIKEKIFPPFYVRLDGRTTQKNKQEYLRQGTISSNINESKASLASIEYVEARLVIKVDDKIVKDELIDINKLDGYEVNEKIPLNDGRTVTMTIIVKDSFGLEHHCMIDSFSQGMDQTFKPLFERDKIYSPEGKLLWQEEFIELNPQ